MRITKLHLLGLFLMCALAFSGHYYFKQKKKEMRLQEQSLQIEQRHPAEDDSAASTTASSSPSASASTSAAPADSPAPVTYTVRKGDTIWKIAKMPEHFGAGRRWYDIWKANEDKIIDFDHLEAGTTITIPLDVPENFPWPATSEDRKARITRKLNPQARRAPIN